jgi:hypothetical protein
MPDHVADKRFKPPNLDAKGIERVDYAQAVSHLFLDLDAVLNAGGQALHHQNSNFMPKPALAAVS